VRAPLHRTGTWLIVLLLLLSAAPLAAKDRTGTICGIVVDERGHGLIRADVFLMDQSGTTLLDSTLTDSRGRFLFHGLFPQDYQLRAEQAGYLPAGLGPLTAESGRMTTAPFVLRQRPVSSPVPPAADGVIPAADSGNAHPPAEQVRPARRAPAWTGDTPPEGTLAETLAGTNRDALKALDRPTDLDESTVPARGLANQPGLAGNLLIATGGSDAAGDQSILMASLSGRALGPMHWTVELSRENNPSLFSSGLGGPLLWRVVRTESAAFELTSMPTSTSDARSPEQTFRLELAEQFTSGDRWSGPGSRSVAAGWDRNSETSQMGLNLLYLAGNREDLSWQPGPHGQTADRTGLLLLGGRIHGEWIPDHELLFNWRHGSLNGEPSALFFATSGSLGGAPGGFITPLAEGWETVINGSDHWRATDPLHFLCRMEYRVSGGESTTQVARSSMGLVYAPFERMSVTSSVGLALRTTTPETRNDGGAAALKSDTIPGSDASRLIHRGLEYGLLFEQGFGAGYNLELDLTVEDVQPGSVTDYDPSQPFGPAAGGMIFLAEGGAARKREMKLSLSKDFGRLLAGTLGTSLLHGEGDILALPAIPGEGIRWAEHAAGGGRVRGVTGHVDTFLPVVGTGILVTFHHLTNLESGLLDQHRSTAGVITGLDVGLRQRILHTVLPRAGRLAARQLISIPAYRRGPEGALLIVP